ncbi:hypothetical protein CEXT_643391 [Caerostris extrusa]|uniref:Uncharacterized protein n=1 Tax=Caerostris extrusa TaxID=172846 RepID=A0AAV4RMX5_CAEEX|nr:hypothetical protein CEXT_643391 [Caerostris extrusa]
MALLLYFSRICPGFWQNPLAFYIHVESAPALLCRRSFKNIEVLDKGPIYDWFEMHSFNTQAVITRCWTSSSLHCFAINKKAKAVGKFLECGVIFVCNIERRLLLK